MVFVATDKMPGVYIDEVQLPGPIPGVATNNVAIIGPAEKGPSNTPVLVTNPTEFAAKFGSFITSPKLIFAAHAVHGFFGNGGTKCYFVRIGPASPALLELKDSKGNTTLSVKARVEGVAGVDPKVAVAHVSLGTSKVFILPGGPVNLANPGAAGRQATIAAEVDLRPGDVVSVADATGGERATIESVAGKLVTFRKNLTRPYATGTITIADLTIQQRRIRLESVAKFEPGAYVEISQGATKEQLVVEAVDKANRAIVLQQGLTKNYAVATPIEVKTLEFTLTVGAETFDELAMDPRHSRFFARVVESDVFELSAPSDPPNPTPSPQDLPVAVGPTALTNGADDVADHNDGHFIKGIDSLELIDEVSMLCAPDSTSAAVQQHLLNHCEKMQDRFAILDSVAGDEIDKVRAQREALQTDRGYGALYYPRIKIRDPNPAFDRLITVPPSGHIAGVFARTDDQKGVHKAPANEALRGVVEIERTLTNVQAGLLNEESVNVLHFFRGRGFRVWGGRTLAASTQWRYVNVRRLMLFIEESIQEACEQFVFDPNNLSLWETIKRQVSGFLTTVWQTGALFGATPKQAFRVRIDEELNPPETRALGQLHIEVIVFPTTPAEFIVFRVIQEPGGPRLVEL